MLHFGNSQWQGSVSAVSSLSEAWKSISTHLAPSTRHFPLAQVGSFNTACQTQLIHDHSNANTKSASLSYFKATSFGASFSSTSQHRILSQTSLEPTKSIKSHKKWKKKYELRRWPAGSKENCYQSLWPQKIEHRENAKATWQHQPINRHFLRLWTTLRPQDPQPQRWSSPPRKTWQIHKITSESPSESHIGIIDITHINTFSMAALFNLRSDNFVTGFPLSPPQNPHLLIVFLEANANISGSNHLFFPFLLSDALFSGNFRFFSCCFVSHKTHLALKDYPQVSWRKALDLPKLLRNENNLFSSFIFLHRFFSSLFSANFFHNQNWNQKSLQNLASSSGSELSRKSW